MFGSCGEPGHNPPQPLALFPGRELHAKPGTGVYLPSQAPRSIFLVGKLIYACLYVWKKEAGAKRGIPPKISLSLRREDGRKWSQKAENDKVCLVAAERENEGVLPHLSAAGTFPKSHKSRVSLRGEGAGGTSGGLSPWRGSRPPCENPTEIWGFPLSHPRHRASPARGGSLSP